MKSIDRKPVVNPGFTRRSASGGSVRVEPYTRMHPAPKKSSPHPPPSPPTPHRGVGGLDRGVGGLDRLFDVLERAEKLPELPFDPDGKSMEGNPKVIGFPIWNVFNLVLHQPKLVLDKKILCSFFQDSQGQIGKDGQKYLVAVVVRKGSILPMACLTLPISVGRGFLNEVSNDLR